MSLTRIMALLGLALLLAGLAAGAQDGRTFAWLSGQCFHRPAPQVCHHDGSRFYGRQYDI